MPRIIYDNLNDMRFRAQEQKSYEKLASVVSGKYYEYWVGSENAYATNYIVHRCVSLLGSNLSKIPLRVYKDDKPMPIDYVLTNGKYSFDVRQPHPRMSLATLLYQCAVYYWYKGEFMALLDEEKLLSLEPLNPHDVKIKKANGHSIEEWKLSGIKASVNADKIIYANVFNPDINGKITDENRTLSPVKVVKAELKNYLSGREFNTQFFNNFAQIGLTLKDIDAATTREEREGIVKELDNTVREGNAWRTKVLPQGLDIVDAKTTTLKEMQLNQMFKDLRDIILGIYGVPRSVFGITNEAGLAQNTVDAEKRIMWTDTIQPVAFQIQEAFNQTLMKRYFPGYKVYFDYSDVKVLQDDMLQKTTLAKSYRELSYTTNEIDELFDLGVGKIDDPALNTRFVPINLNTYENLTLIPEENEENTPEEPEPDEKIKAICELMEKEATQKIPPGLRKKMTSKLSGHFSKQLGSVLGVVKNDDLSSKTALMTKLSSMLNSDKSIIGTIMLPFFEELKSIKEKDGAEEAINRIKNINNHVYFKIKNTVVSKNTVDEMSDGIVSLYKTLAKYHRKVVKNEIALWMEE